LEGPAVTPPAGVPATRPVVGRGAALYPDVLGPVHPPEAPDAGTLARLVAHRLASGGELLPPKPLYLRRPDAASPGPRKRVTA
ncbi:MAG: tRNA (adenosine(37)-N6)-threonylcarbamoyltransferase complex dimerization subunit type 1 TsaB, partial [Actinomycetes bacterium]